MQRRDFLHFAARLAAAGSMLALPGTAGADDGVRFAPVLRGRPLRFPEDHGAHPDYRTEWWYATGWLVAGDEAMAASDSTRFADDRAVLGFQTTFFRVRTGIGEDNPSRFAPQQLLLAHAAIADPGLGRLRHAERAARARSDPHGDGARAGFESGRTAVWIDDWRFEQQTDRYRAHLRAEDFAYQLDLMPAGPPLLQGAGGFSQKAADPRHASYYYSRPQLAVSGEVTLAGKTRAVAGRAWLDHEWSSELLPPGAQGWDWIGINLDDGGALMAFRMRDAQGRTLWAAATLVSGSFVQRLTVAEVHFEPLADWRSPRTGIACPVEWRLKVGDRAFELRALMPDQELDSRRSTGAIYWEGAARLFEGGREIGRGYLEMTGYGDRIRVG